MSKLPVAEERDRFDAAMRVAFGPEMSLLRDGIGYFNPTTQLQWVTWQVARAALRNAQGDGSAPVRMLTAAEVEDAISPASKNPTFLDIEFACRIQRKSIEVNNLKGGA